MPSARSADRERRVVIVTGGGAGIGKACALRFSQAGYCVVVADISASAAETTCRLVEESDGHAIACAGDIADENSSIECARAALERWGRIDVLVANAGVQIRGDLLQATEADWDTILGVNLKGVAYSCKAVIPALVDRRGGAIVVVSSVNALFGSAGMAVYDASKAAVLGLMRNLAVQYGSQGIRVNAICPGNTLTDFHINKMAENGIGIEQLRELTRGYGLLGRAAEPGEIANAVYFLASEQASFITGQTLLVDGGFSVTGGTH